MKNQLNKILKVTLIIIFFIISKSYAIEDVSELTNAVNEAREEFNNVLDATNEQSKIIDEAIKEIDKATEYVQDAINNNNAEDAIKTLEFIEKSLSDVGNIIPQEFSSDMSNIDIAAMSKEDMDIITEMTTQMAVVKEKKENDFMADLFDLNLKGIDTVSISENLDGLGIDTIKLVLDVEGAENLEKWSKEQWAKSYTGDILTSTGSEVITDKEVPSKIKELEDKFQENTFKIENKRIELVSLNTQLDPLNNEVQSLNEKKTILTSQYNLELAKLGTKNLSELETQNTIELSEKLNNQIENISNEVLQTEQKSNSLSAEISSLKKSLNDQISQSNKIREDIKNLNQNKLELSDSIALQTAKLNELKGQNSELSSNSNIAELTVKLDASEKLKTELTVLQSQIESKNLVVSDKITEVNSLNNQLDPLSDQIKSLQEKREAFQNQYNSEISNINYSFNDNELIKSQQLAENLNNNINSVTSEIKSIEASSSQIKNDISQINFEINSEKNMINKITFELTKSQKDLDGTLSMISSKEFQLDQLKNSDLAQANQNLNTQLNQMSLQRDFIESQFEKSIDLEVDALQRYHTALGDTEDEIDFAMREVGVILDSDPRKARAFEIEKYATYAGLSKDFIQNSVDAVNNDDWDAQKGIYKDITKALAKSPNWSVDVPSNAEINVMMAEEKAIQEAALASIQVNEIRSAWNEKINEQINDVGPIASLQASTIQYAVTWEGMPEHEFLVNERNKIITESDLGVKMNNLVNEISEKQNQVNQLIELDQQRKETIKKELDSIKKQMSDNFTQVNQLNSELNVNSNKYYSEYNKVYDDLNAAIYGAGKTSGTTSGPTAEFKAMGYAAQKEAFDKLTSLRNGSIALRNGRGLVGVKQDLSAFSPEMKKVSKQIIDNENRLQEVKKTIQKQNLEITDIISKNQTSVEDIQRQNDLSSQLSKASMEKISVENEIDQLARGSLITQVKEAKNKVKEIYSQESPELKAVEEKVSSILKEIPTFEGQADNLAGLDATTLRAKLVDLTNGSNNETEALKAAKKAMSEMGKTHANKYMTGPYWEMTNVKAAAIVRGKKYDYVDDYEYMNAYYDDPLELNTSQRQEIETELKNVLGNNNPKLNALNNQVNSLKLEIDTNNVQLSNINGNISKLENEILSIKSSEENLKNQISNLNSDLLSKQSIIEGKNKSLTDLQKNLDPINNKISELEVKKNDLNNNIQNQINLISENTQKSEEITQKTSELENKFSKELSEIDQQIEGYKKETEQLSVNISTLNNDILTLENDKPDLSIKISKINEELISYSNAKAELSILTAEQKSEFENIDIEINKLESELSNFKTSENQINQQLASLSNELKSKENIMNSNNLSIAEIQKQIDPLNSQINTLENQKVSLNEQFNIDIADLSKQIGQTTETKSVELDELKANFETQISSLNEEINNFETQANDLNSTVSALNEEIKSIEVETPEISNQITKLNQDFESFTSLKADFAMATAKKLGINVDEKVLKSVEVIDGKVVVAIEGTNLVSIVDKKELINDAAKFIDTTSKLSINTKVYTAGALNKELITQEFIDAAKSISVSAKIDVIAQASAIEAVGATTEQSAKYASAKATRLAARKEWNAAMASGDKAASEAAESAFMAARDIEQAAGQAATSAAMAASAASSAAQSATEQVASVAKDATAAAAEAASQVQDVVASAQSAQKAALSALQELEALPGATGFHSQEVQAAIESVKAEMDGRDYSYMGYSSYDEAMKEIERMEKTGVNAVQCMSDKNGGQGEGC